MRDARLGPASGARARPPAQLCPSSSVSSGRKNRPSDPRLSTPNAFLPTPPATTTQLRRPPKHKRPPGPWRTRRGFVVVVLSGPKALRSVFLVGNSGSRGSSGSKNSNAFTEVKVFVCFPSVFPFFWPRWPPTFLPSHRAELRREGEEDAKAPARSGRFPSGSLSVRCSRSVGGKWRLAEGAGSVAAAGYAGKTPHLAQSGTIPGA